MRGDIQPLDLIFFADTQFNDQVTALRPARLSTPGVSTAVGERDQSVKLFLESKVTDSASGEVLAATVSELSGEDLENVKSNLEAQKLGKSFTAASGLMSTNLKEIFSK
jgi:hypothetical protein